MKTRESIFESLCDGELAALFEREFERIANSFGESPEQSGTRTLTIKLVFKQKQGYQAIDLIADVHTKMPSVKRMDVMSLQEDARQSGQFHLTSLGEGGEPSRNEEEEGVTRGAFGVR